MRRTASMTVNVIDPTRVQQKSFVKSVDWLNEIDSTNSYAIRNVSNAKQIPWLVGANSQTSGRGRGGNRWWGMAGSLTFSVVVPPRQFKIESQHWPLMSLMVGLAIRECLAECVENHEVQLKWPNDVYVAGKKICGILIETIPAQREIVVIGIGLNVNNSLSSAPSDVQARATSLCELANEKLPLEEILISLLGHLEMILKQFPTQRIHLIDEWKRHCYLTGKQLQVDDSHKQIVGKCLGVDDDGGLILQTLNGRQKVLAGTVTLL